MIEIRLQRSTYTVIEEETSTHLVITGQSSALHLWPSLGLLSPGRLSRRQHGGRFHACSYTCGSILCRHRRWGSLGVQKHGADPTEPCFHLGAQEQPPAPVHFFHTGLVVPQPVPATARADGTGSGMATEYCQQLEELPCFPVAATNPKGGCDVQAGVKACSHHSSCWLGAGGHALGQT